MKIPLCLLIASRLFLCRRRHQWLERQHLPIQIQEATHLPGALLHLLSHRLGVTPKQGIGIRLLLRGAILLRTHRHRPFDKPITTIGRSRSIAMRTNDQPSLQSPRMRLTVGEHESTSCEYELFDLFDSSKQMCARRHKRRNLFDKILRSPDRSLFTRIDITKS